MTQNKLKIQAESLDLELCGDADYVRDAYTAIRSVVIERFKSALIKGDQPAGDPSLPRQRRITKPLYKVPEVEKHFASSRAIADQHLRLVVCGDLYHKVSVIARQDFRESIFDAALDIDLLKHLYINEDDAPTLQLHLPIGRTLWRELTPAGRDIVQGNSS